MDYIKAFVTGGLLCAAVQILMDKTKLMPGRIMVLLVVCGSILGAIGLYEPYAKWAGSGAVYRRIHGGCGGDFRGVDLRLSVVADLQTQDEGLERRRKKSKRKQGKRK